jgi:hypothetical protein
VAGGSRSGVSGLRAAYACRCIGALRSVAGSSLCLLLTRWPSLALEVQQHAEEAEEDEHTQTFVTFADGDATQAIHVGTIVHLVGPNGRLVDIAGQQVFEVEDGFDHTLVSEHGVDFDFASDAALCAAFS